MTAAVVTLLGREVRIDVDVATMTPKPDVDGLACEALQRILAAFVASCECETDEARQVREQLAEAVYSIVTMIGGPGDTKAAQ